MVEIADYERRGDLDAPFELTKKAEKAQRQSEEIRAAVRCEIPSLTWEQFAAGEPCPGCGRSYRDEERWESKGTMHFTDEERARYEAEGELFKERHGDCHAMRHKVSGSLTTHCGRCCPPPPMSPEQRELILRLFSCPTPPQQLMRWRLRLYCGHVVEKTAHYTHKTLHAAFSGATSCPECGLDPATIVDGAAVGLKAEPPGAPRTGAPRAARRSRKPTKAELQAKVSELEAEVERLQRK
ncbi:MULTISPECIES: hypothetical protein [Arthrobacter]|uniref:Uncharacterized protein n=2 Tax=Arthrobacter TaxID=1663 RepID=A0ABU9KJ02_9MICC|nr:hypothetical protein [Arthrobacter sp. YJM1]MDP5226882.1 hypothetical protein [Arthrobacter sp. YJM1]